MASLAVVDWVMLDQAPGAVQVGDLVSADAGGMPTYRVIAVEEGKARLQGDEDAREWVLPLSAFHWKAAPQLSV
jgi:hypothetical protein